jgi:hypothetical protein
MFLNSLKECTDAPFFAVPRGGKNSTIFLCETAVPSGSTLNILNYQTVQAENQRKAGDPCGN